MFIASLKNINSHCFQKLYQVDVPLKKRRCTGFATC